MGELTPDSRKKMMPDAFLKVRFKTSSEGGRSTPIRGEFYACPMFVEGEGFDCRLLLAGVTLELGQWYEVPVKFMNKDLIVSKLKVGTTVSLWEGKDIAEGEVLRLA
jgi:hypothetical protein